MQAALAESVELTDVEMLAHGKKRGSAEAVATTTGPGGGGGAGAIIATSSDHDGFARDMRMASRCFGGLRSSARSLFGTPIASATRTSMNGIRLFMLS